MKRLLFGSIASGVIALAALSAGLIPAAAGAEMNSGFYGHQIIPYEATAEVPSSPQAAQLISKGNVFYHGVAPDGSTPPVQCARLIAALPNVGSSCNVLNFIPTELGYEGGACNLQIFHWAPGVTTVELSKDDDILAAVAARRATLEVTNILVRCPGVNFAALR